MLGMFVRTLVSKGLKRDRVRAASAGRLGEQALGGGLNPSATKGWRLAGRVEGDPDAADDLAAQPDSMEGLRSGRDDLDGADHAVGLVAGKVADEGVFAGLVEGDGGLACG